MGPIKNTIIEGTFSLGWTEDIVQALQSLGLQAIGDHPLLQDPFALLLHRIEHPDAIYVTSLTDTVYHPQVVILLRELASILLPPGPWTSVDLHCDLDALFDRCIHRHKFRGTLNDISHFQKVPPYIHVQETSVHKAPPYVADTPEMLSVFLMGLKGVFPALDSIAE